MFDSTKKFIFVLKYVILKTIFDRIIVEVVNIKIILKLLMLLCNSRISQIIN